MKKIGLIAGMSWESSALYYRHLNVLVASRLGDLHSAEIIIQSVDYAPFLQLAAAGRWNQIALRLGAISKNLEEAGADFILIACNTVHKVADYIESQISVPLLHIVDPCADSITSLGIKTVGLLGTRHTTEGSFFKGRLKEHFSIQTIVPDEKDREYLHSVIADQFCKGIFLPETKGRVLAIIESLADQGAEGIILGCTELPILLKPEDCTLPLFDTAFLHAKAAVDLALAPDMHQSEFYADIR